MSRRNVILFLFAGIFHVLVGFFLAGAGHGWVTGFYFSLISLILYPLARYALVSDTKMASSLILAGNICLTIFMYRSGIEGDEYFLKTWRGVPFLTVCYFLLWFGWGGIALVTLLKKRN